MISLESPKARMLADAHKMHASIQVHPSKSNQVGTVLLYGVPIVSLVIENQERLCLAQISNTLLKEFSYNEIHNRRVALGITCVQCTPVQLEILRRAGAMPVSSRRCGMITRREAERLCKSFLGDNTPPRLPDDFAFSVHHECAWGCRGAFLPSRYNSSRAKCIKCTICGLFFSPNKFIFHSHRTGPNAKYVQPDAANFNSWRRHMRLSGNPPVEVVHAWEDVKAMFNGGTRKRLLSSSSNPQRSPPVKSPGAADPSPPPFPLPPPAPTRVPPLPIVMDYTLWHKHPLSPYSALPWLGLPPTSPLLLPPTDGKLYPSAFHPVYSAPRHSSDTNDDEETVDIETCPEDDVKPCWSPERSTAEKPDTPTPEPDAEVDVGSERVEVVELERPKGKDVDVTPATTSIPVPATPAVPQEPPLWSVARLHRDWPDRALYRHEVARHLSLMRELVSPGGETGNGGPGLSFLSLHTPVPEMNRSKYKDKSAVNSKVDCSTCHQIAGSYSGSLTSQNNN